jgi:hypothetical protein
VFVCVFVCIEEQRKLKEERAIHVHAHTYTQLWHDAVGGAVLPTALVLNEAPALLEWQVLTLLALLGQNCSVYLLH